MPSATGKVLVVDQDGNRSKKLQTIFEFLEYPTAAFCTPENWFEVVAAGSPLSAAMVGVSNSETTATSIVTSLRQQRPELPIILLQGEQAASRTLKHVVQGVLDFPLRYQKVQEVLGKIHNGGAVTQPNGVQRSGFRGLVGKSAHIAEVRQLVRQVAGSDASVLITGESGTGKEVVARKVHYFSSRCNGPFVPVNCGAIPAELLESELFGHEKGAFTGAVSARPGRFEMAQGGTLFLDEIGDMPLSMQVKLLRVLQERTFERVGSNRTIAADVRIVAATHQNLEQLVLEDRFRMDLFYRLNVFPIPIKPLRERSEDIEPLVQEFLGRMKAEGRGSIDLTPCAIAALGKYPWPGNVRELANVVERLAILHPGQTIRWFELPEKYRVNGDWVSEAIEHQNDVALSENQALWAAPQPSHQLPETSIDLRAYLSDIERDMIEQALAACGGVVAKAAKRLTLQRTTLVEKMRKYNIQREASS